MPLAKPALLLLGFLLAWAMPAAAGSVFSSQLGYAPGDPMVAVLAVPAGSAVQSSFSVISVGSGATVFSATHVAYPGGWAGNNTAGDTYLLDFTAAALPEGVYRVSSNNAASAPFTVSTNIYDLTRFKPLEFFRIQMSGSSYTLTSMDGTIISHNPDHRDDARQATRRDKGGGDSALIQQDALALAGGRKDVTGGWADAGDYNKYMGNTPWAAYLLLLTLEQNSAYWSAIDDDRNGNPDLREVTRPALEWMLKMQHTDGSIFERVFNGYGALFDGRPDLETDNISGNTDDRPLDTDRYADITAKSTWAWAVGARIFGDSNYLNAAVRAWNWANANQTRVKAKVYGGGLYFGDVEMGLTLGALEIHRAQLAAGLTPDTKYMSYAAARVQAHLTAGDWINPSSWDAQQSQVLMRYYEFASAEDKARIVAQLKGRWDAGIATQSRNAYRMNDEWIYGDFGQNEQSASGAGDALWLYQTTGERKYYDYAVNQMAWIFGRNPFGESFMAFREAAEYTRLPHWRGTAKHPIEGVVVPGATDRNTNRLPDYTDTGDWFYAEPSLNQQAMFIRTMTALFTASGGVVAPPADLPPAVTITAPSAGATLTGSVTVSASASDTGGVTSLAYRVDNGSTVSMSQTSGSSLNGQWSASLDTTQLPDGTHNITVIATDTASQQSSPSIGISIRNSTTQKTHVERIDVALVVKSSRAQAKCDPLIKDAFGVSVASAVVKGHWSGAASDIFSITTDATGKATDYSNSTTLVRGITFTCVIDSVSKSGWTYDASANKQSSASVTAP